MSGSQVWAADVEVLTPSPGATIVGRNPETHLILRQPDSANPSQVLAETSQETINPIVSTEYGGQRYLHFRLPLERGKNSFTILATGEGIEINFKQLQAAFREKSQKEGIDFFHRDGKLPKNCEYCHDLKETDIVDPVGLKKQTSCASCHKNILDDAAIKHSATKNEQCLSCHHQSGTPYDIGIPTGKIQEICFACHTGKRDWFSRKSLHGPLLLGGCTLCHNPHGEDHRYQLWAEGSLAICIDCHSDKKNLIDEKERLPFVHGIIPGGGCVACHDPHATDFQFMLREPTNDLCVGCHPKFARMKRGHPIGGHPVAAPKENRRPGRELTCASCHDPHGSAHQSLLIATIQGGNLCSVCHQRR